MKVPDTDNRPADITYFYFRSNVTANTFDCRASKKSLALEFSLRLPHALSQSALPSTAIPLSVPTSPFASAPPHPVETLAFTLGNLLDDILTGMDANELLKVVINARDTIISAPSPPILHIAPFNLFLPLSLFLHKHHPLHLLQR